jgi:peptidoglycan/xylan/chitin deacetylase (PgdA/CDA1 family)
VFEGSSEDQRRARRAARDRADRRRRVTAVGVLVGVVTIVAVTLSRISGPAAAPPEPVVGSVTTARPPQPRETVAAGLRREDRSIDEVLAYTPYIVRGSRRSKEVALTFDDGPGPTTPALLRYLLANDVPATFFLVGNAIAEHPAVVRKQFEAGFALGTHTKSHARLGSKSSADQSQEILSAADRITAITGHAVKLFRPPYGSFDANTLKILEAERMLMVLWNVDTKDYSAGSSKPIVYTALSGARAGSVVLMHDGPGARPRTLAAISKIVPALRRKGYRLVSLPELLRDDPPPHDQPAPHSLAG